jgi:radical SAM protein with 4Fe4S-binding SPASM domain
VGFLDYKEMKARKRGLKYPWACPQIFQRMAVWWDGTLLPCNHDDDGLLALGNAGEAAVASCWNSEALSGLREKHRSGNAHEVRACDGCYLRDSEILKLMEREKEAAR